MKLFFPLLFISTPLLAQVCTEHTLSTATDPLFCDSLEINSSVDLRGTHSGTPIEINVSGNALINASINISGQNGSLLTSDGPGGLGGPNGGAGGGSDFLDSAPGSVPPYGGNPGLLDFATTCGDGASGGGFVTQGEDGTPCGNSTNAPSSGGQIVDLSNIESTLSGGHGGGSGARISSPIASGGGGGGALYLKAQNIKLTSKASIIANGGKGADSINLNGAGGGGSGGLIILEAQSFQIEGRLAALGGEGGRASNGGHGGKGAHGLIRLKDADGTEDFVGEKNPTSPLISKELNLDSNISCGVIKANEENPQNFLFLLMTPFLALMLINYIKRKVLVPFLK